MGVMVQSLSKVVAGPCGVVGFLKGRGEAVKETVEMGYRLFLTRIMPGWRGVVG